MYIVDIYIVCIYMNMCVCVSVHSNTNDDNKQDDN